MKKFKVFAFLLITALVLAACGNSGEEGTSSGDAGGEEKITISHKFGEAEIAKNPKQVVVFDFGILDTLDELGIEVAGVPQANIPPYLEQYEGEQYTNVGSLKEPDFEAIHALKPDVIFISTRQAELYDQFAEIAPTVYMAIDYNNYYDSFKSNMETIGKVFGKEDIVADELAAIDESIQAVKEKTAGMDEEALIVMGTEGKVSAFGPASRFGVIHDVFGFKAADENIEQSTHGQSITFEYILETNPDILFVIDRDAAVSGESSVKESLENELVQKTNAYKNGKIYYLDPNYWYLSGGGLQSMKEMIAEMDQAL